MTWGKDHSSRARGSFEEQWPELLRGLDHALRARRIPTSRREDIIQETGLRLFVRWSELDPERPIWPFALTIALNLMKDEQRMQARRNASPHHADDGIARGVEEEALARLELTSVQVALQKLTPAQRSVLLADLGELPYDDRAPAALKMLRMRARRTLRSVIDRASALIPLAGAYLRRVTNSAGVSLQKNAGAEHAQLVAISTLGIAGAATIVAISLGVVHPAGGGADGTSVIPARHEISAGAPALARDLPQVHTVAPAARDHSGTRALRATRLRHGHRPDEESPVPAKVAAGGTGIDEEPSLTSDRWRIWVFAQAAVSGHEAIVDYEVEQSNPVCGSPTESGGSGRTCLRPEPPRTHGQAGVKGAGSASVIGAP